MFSLVLTTVENRTKAKRLGKKLVLEKLAACASAVPNVDSIYWWNGKIEQGTETLLLIKTSEKKLGRLIPRIKELHSYKVPEVLVVPIKGGSPEYLKWLKRSLK